MSFVTKGAAVAVAAVLAACGGGGGGGGGSDPPVDAGSAEGVWVGRIGRTFTISGMPLHTDDQLHALVLPGGEYWLVSSFLASGDAFATGFVTGRGSVVGNTFRDEAATDFAFGDPPVGPLSVGFAAGGRFDGTLSNSVGGATVNAGWPAPAVHHHAQRASAADIAGTWAVRNAVFTPGTLVVADSGALSGELNGCTVTGTLSPHPSGRNVFVSSVLYGPLPCPVPNQTATGVAFSVGLPDGRRQLSVVGLIPSRTYASAFAGVR